MHKEELKQLSEYYLRHILDDVMPFWDARCVDEEYGGFLPALTGRQADG